MCSDNSLARPDGEMTMNTSIMNAASGRNVAAVASRGRSASDLLVPIGRALFASIFVLASGEHFALETIRKTAEQGVPLAYLLVPASGVLSLLGGMSVLVGYRVKLGA